MTFPTLSIQVGFTTTTTEAYWHIGDSARGKIGTAAVGPSDGIWTDVTSYALSFRTSRGANRAESPVIRYEAGKCSIVLNNSDRRFDPTNLSGPYVSAGVTQVTPMRPVRIRATHNSVTYDVWRGYADSWTLGYDGPNFSSCTLTATDGQKVLAAYDRAASGSVGAGEDTGARISRILDSAGWPAADRVISTGDCTVQATTLDGPAWTEMLQAHDAELGELYVDEAGRVVFRNRVAVLETSRSNTSQTTFGDGGGSELPYIDVVPEYDDENLYNVVRATRTGGAVQTAQDTDSQADYLVHALENTSLILDSDAQAASWAGFVLHMTKDPELRFAQLTVNPRNSDSATEELLWPQVLGRQIGDRITVMLRPPGGGSTIERDVFVRGVTHEARPLRWQTVWVLQSATRYQFWTIGHATLGQVGTVNAIA